MIYRTRELTLMRWIVNLQAGDNYVPMVIRELQDMIAHKEVDSLARWLKMLIAGEREQVIKEMHKEFDIEHEKDQETLYNGKVWVE